MKVQTSLTTWRADYAYALGLQAYIFCFPWLRMAQLRWDWVNVPKPEGAITPYAPLNHFANLRRLVTAEFRQGGALNNDTLYSFAWVDLGKGPLILSHPDMGDRYFCFEIAQMSSDNFAYVGKRTTGGAEGHFAIVGPGWSGRLPDDVVALPPSPTSTALIFGRTLVSGPDDLPAAHRLQNDYRLTPLRLWGMKRGKLPVSRDVWAPYDAEQSPLADWKTINRMMSENSPEASQAAIVDSFAVIGVGPGKDVDAMDEATCQSLARAAVDGRRLLNEAVLSGDLGPSINGWTFPPQVCGRAGQHGDYLVRAALQSFAGIVANDSDEAMHITATSDSLGRPLDGSKQYNLRFAPGELPPVDGFWSLTLYDLSANLVPNPLARYAIGDRTLGLERDSDGGLTLHVGGVLQDGARAANWLPAPRSGGFMLILRAYLPSPAVVDRTWTPPTLVLT